MLRVEFIGNATLILGDCQELCDLDRPYAFDACVTDPPFGIAYKSGHATPDLWKAGNAIEGDGDTALRDRVLLTMRPLPTLAFGSWPQEEVMVCECYDDTERMQEANARFIAAAANAMPRLLQLAEIAMRAEQPSGPDNPKGTESK